MNIVIDTNVVISGVFFGGYPRKVLNAVLKGELCAYASPEIISEYYEIVDEMISRKKGVLNSDVISLLVRSMEIISPSYKTDICRDPDDNKFLECAKDCQALYIVSGDNDLLVLENFEGTQIITAKDFCNKYL
jgi:putative PIN family toxin of toxin-antitoxin system